MMSLVASDDAACAPKKAAGLAPYPRPPILVVPSTTIEDGHGEGCAAAFNAASGGEDAVKSSGSAPRRSKNLAIRGSLQAAATRSDDQSSTMASHSCTAARFCIAACPNQPAEQRTAVQCKRVFWSAQASMQSIEMRVQAHVRCNGWHAHTRATRTHAPAVHCVSHKNVGASTA